VLSKTLELPRQLLHNLTYPGRIFHLPFLLWNLPLLPCHLTFLLDSESASGIRMDENFSKLEENNNRPPPCSPRKSESLKYFGEI